MISKETANQLLQNYETHCRVFQSIINNQINSFQKKSKEKSPIDGTLVPNIIRALKAIANGEDKFTPLADSTDIKNPKIFLKNVITTKSLENLIEPFAEGKCFQHYIKMKTFTAAISRARTAENDVRFAACIMGQAMRDQTSLFRKNNFGNDIAIKIAAMATNNKVLPQSTGEEIAKNHMHKPKI